jgi:predicted kinase
VTSRAAPSAAWIIAGAPGAGKTTVAGLLARRLDPVPALLDKDTIYARFVAATLKAAGRPFGEREGPWYDENIKVHEYGGMAEIAREIRAAGCPAMLVAPFTGQTRHPDRWQSYVDALGGEPVHLVWVRLDEATLRARIINRGHDRDGQKLAKFDEFTASTLPNTPPPIPHIEIDNRHEAPPLDDQIVRALAACAPAENDHVK